MKRMITATREITEDMLQEFECRMYGNYTCSCGCGQILGTPGVRYSSEDVCKCVGLISDEEGYYWRTFRPSCWNRLNLDDKPLTYIYNKFPPAPVVG